MELLNLNDVVADEICGPGDERLAHPANEHVELAAVLAAADFYFKLIQRRLAC